MKPSDQTLKKRIVLLTAAFALIGFFLEVGPVGAYQLVITGMSVGLPTFGFLAYLSLAAAAAVGLHLSEDEPRPKEEKPEAGPVQPSREAVGERTRPEMHQLRMLVTALGGYVLLKGISTALASATTSANAAQLLSAFYFGLAYTALGWFLLWQFLRWYAYQQQWVRLQAELVGVDVAQVVAVIFLIKPLYFFISGAMHHTLYVGVLSLPTILLNLAVIALAAILWTAHPYTLRRTIISLLAVGAIIVLLTLLLIPIEHHVIG